MLDTIITRKNPMQHWAILTMLVGDANSIRRQLYPKLSYSYAAYKEAYYALLGSMSANWARKFPEALEKLEEDLELVRGYEAMLRKIPAHLQNPATIN